MLITYAPLYGNVGATEYGVSYSEVGSDLTAPANMVESVWDKPAGAHYWHAQVRGEQLPWLFLSEHDWNYYLPLDILGGTTAEMVKIEGVPDADWIDPGSVVFIPEDRYAPGGGSYTVEGVTRDSSGKVLGSCTVQLFESDSSRLVEEKTSDADGAYSFSVPNPATAYFTRAYKDGAKNVFGITDRNLVGT
jgi:hypothetical protein